MTSSSSGSDGTCNGELSTSIIIVTYQSARYIEACLKSVLLNAPSEVIVVDNASTDGTVDFVKTNFPSVKVIIDEENIGYGSAVNKGVAACSGEIAVILNPDTKVEFDWLTKLIKPFSSTDHVIVIPRIMVYDGSVVNTCGTIGHFTGLSFTNGLGKPFEEVAQTIKVTGISGACFAIRRADFLELGGFDEEIFLYMEDVELSWRAHANGYSFAFVPESVIYHDYRLNVNAEKLFRLENGRYYLLRKFLTNKDVISIAPSLLMTELMSWGYAFILGKDGIMYKTKTMKRMFFNPRMVHQREFKNFLNTFNDKIPMDQLTYGPFDRVIKKWANAVYSANFRILKK